MINIEEKLKEKGISKVVFAEMLKIVPQNVSRTIKRLEDNQSEIDYILGLLDCKIDTSYESENLSETNRNLSETVKTQARIIEKLASK